MLIIVTKGLFVQTVATALREAEVLIALVSTWKAIWLYGDLFRSIIEENLLENCTIVLKLISNPSSSRMKNVKAGNILRTCGLSDNWNKGNKCVYIPYMIIVLNLPVVNVNCRCCG